MSRLNSKEFFAKLGSQMAKISNKRITRLQTRIELKDDKFQTRLVNRNPRNLEQMAFDNKPSGFWMDRNKFYYWNRLTLEQEGSHYRACLRHWSGKKIIEVSTKEHQLAKYFSNPGTLQAVSILAQVLARRCLQSGYVYADAPEAYSPKTISFYKTLEESGITLREPPPIVSRLKTDI